jgi:hypothetical protein
LPSRASCAHKFCRNGFEKASQSSVEEYYTITPNETHFNILDVADEHEATKCKIWLYEFENTAIRHRWHGAK